MFKKYHLLYSDEKSFLKDLEFLLNKGFVFNSNYRLKTVKEIKNLYAPHFSRWKVLQFGENNKCSRVIEASPNSGYINLSPDSKSITLEEFLKLDY